MRSRVEVFEEIRRDRRVGGLSIRQLAERYQVHRRTVRQALASATPPPRKEPPPVAPVDRDQPRFAPWCIPEGIRVIPDCHPASHQD